MPFNLFAPSTWLSGFGSSPQPTGLFQTRVTRTPGGVAPMDPEKRAVYNDRIDPLQVVAQSNLPPEQKAALMSAWKSQGPGFITAQPDQVQNSPVMRHEQIHALQQQAGLNPYANEIAGLVNPGLVDQIRNTPIYQQEFKQYGEAPTIADEGSAFQLTMMPNDSSTPNLQDAIMRHLKTQVQQKQLARLTSPRG